MEQARRTQVLALLFVLCVTALLRYPIYPNEFAGDTLELHFETDELRQKGTQGFALSPLSWFGLYPVSYAQGVPIIAAIVGETGGVPSDVALAICGIMFGLLGVLGFFILAYRLTDNFAISLVCAASLATSGFSVPQSIWGLSGRAAVQSVFPFALWAILPAHHRLSSLAPPLLAQRLLVITALNVAMAAFHRLFLLALLTEVLAVAVLIIRPRLMLAFPAVQRALGNVPMASFLIAGAILAWGAFTLKTGTRAGPAFLREFFVTSDQRLFVFGYFLEFAYDTGPFVILLISGIIVALRGSVKWSTGLSALLIPFAVEFFMVVPSFSSVTLAPITGILLGMGWHSTSRTLRFGAPLARKGAAILLGVVAVAAFGFQGYFQLETQEPHRNPDRTSFYVDQESIEAGVYLRWDTANTTFITPDLTDSRRVAASGHVATVSSEAMLFGANPNLRQNITIEFALSGGDATDLRFYIDAAEALIESKTLYQAYDWITPGGGYGQGNHWGQVITLQASTGRILDAYQVDHVLVNNYRSSSPLTSLVRANYYVEYANSLETVYMVQHDAGCLYGQRRCP